jgi:uncharacterized membrane protein YesL
MGLFNYSKPGKGVEKDENQSNFRIFFEVLQRKFWNLIYLNLLYLICSILLLAIYFILMPKDTSNLAKTYVFAISVTLHLSVVGLGFIAPGFTYILRNYSREQHAFLFSDFFTSIKNNFKQGFVLFIIDTLVTYILYISLSFYFSLKVGNAFTYFAETFIISIGLVYLIMHFYIYQIMVTFKMPMIKIMQNSFILTIAHLPQNIAVLIIIVIVAALTFYFSIPFGVLLAIFITISLMGYIVNFIAQSIIERYIVE